MMCVLVQVRMYDDDGIWDFQEAFAIIYKPNESVYERKTYLEYILTRLARSFVRIVVWVDGVPTSILSFNQK